VQDITSPLFDGSVLSECNSDDSSSYTDHCSPRPPVTNDTDSGAGCDLKHVKLMQKHLKSDKLCAVCGDKALGCNFDAISCESCKAFFRRNAFKESVRMSSVFWISVRYFHVSRYTCVCCVHVVHCILIFCITEQLGSTINTACWLAMLQAICDPYSQTACPWLCLSAARLVLWTMSTLYCKAWSIASHFATFWLC